MSIQLPPPDSIFRLTNHELYAVTAREGERDNAMIAAYIVPATLVTAPRRLVMALSVENLTTQMIARTGVLAVQMLAEGQAELVPRLGLRSGRDGDKLAGLVTGRTPAGLPLIGGTCGWAECRVVAQLDSGDRQVLLADVTAEALEPGRRPLHKLEAFGALPEATVAALVKKATDDAARDAGLIRRF